MNSLDKALLAMERGCPSGTVLREADVLASYAIDESETTPVVPSAVVRAANTAQISHVMKCAHRHGIPVTPRAGGTGRVGGSVPVPGGIVLSFEQMDQIKGIENDNLIAVVEPGAITGRLHEEAQAEKLFYPPDPNSLQTCAIGGNIATNAGGPRAFKYGVTREYVLGMEVVLADGKVLQLGKQTVKGVTGYDLASLIVGSEGTLAIVTEATLKLMPMPQKVATLLVFLTSPQKVSPSLRRLTNMGIVPRCMELLDAVALDAVKADAGVAIPKGTGAMLLLELDGDGVSIEADLERCGNALNKEGALEILVAQNGTERDRLWSARRELSRTLRKQSAHKLSEDVVVPRTKVAQLLSRCVELSEKNDIVMPTYGHAGDGNLHVNFLWDNDDDRPRVDTAIHQLFESVLQMKGTLSGEHGIGVLKAPYLPMEQSPALIELQQNIKNLFDPMHILNPGKIFPADAKRFHGVC